MVGRALARLADQRHWCTTLPSRVCCVVLGERPTFILPFNVSSSHTNMCPSGYTTATSVRTESPGTVVDLFCRSDLPARATNVYATTTLQPGPIPTSPTLQTVSFPAQTPVYVWADILQVRWQTTDSEILNLLTSSTGGSAWTTSSNGGVRTANPANDEPSLGHANSGISRGAVVGIILGVLFFVAWGVVAGWVILSLRKRRHYQAGDADGWVKTEFDAESDGMASPRSVAEADWSINPANLSAVDDGGGEVAGETSRGLWPAQ